MALNPTIWKSNYLDIQSRTLINMHKTRARPQFLLDKCALIKSNPIPKKIWRKNHNFADYFVNSYTKAELETGQVVDHRLLNDLYELSAEGVINFPVVKIPESYDSSVEWAIKRCQQDNPKHKMNTRVSNPDISLIVQGVQIKREHPGKKYPVIVSCDSDIPSILMGLKLKQIGLLIPELFKEWNEEVYYGNKIS